MDNHIPKLVNKQCLIKTLCKWLARAKVYKMAAGEEQKLRFLLSFVDAKAPTSSANASSNEALLAPITPILVGPICHIASSCFAKTPSRQSATEPSITVTAGGSGYTSPGFVTIHDYVTAVNPWLLAQEVENRAAIGILPMAPLPENFEVLLYPRGLSPLSL